MRNLFSEKLINLAKSCPYPLYAVGGAVRDSLAGAPFSGDTDICAPCGEDDFVSRVLKAGFKVDAVYKTTGTVKISADGKSFEFARFRTDEYERGGHTPKSVKFTDDIMLDARRRDFRCNAVYYDIARDELCDPLGGVEDIRRKVLSCVVPADKVFSEDGLRLMRLARQAAQTGFSPDGEAVAGARKNRMLIRDVACERINAELGLILGSDGRSGDKTSPYKGLKILDITRVLDVIIPELCEGRGISQRADFHKYDVLEHSLRAVLYAPADVRLAALLHDVGKPYAYRAAGNFYRHEEYGGQLAENILARLKFPKKTQAECARLILLHMYDTRLDAREGKIRRFIVENYDIFDKILELKQADFSACKDDLQTAPCVVKWRHILQKMRSEGAPCTLSELKISGAEIIAAGVLPKNCSEVLKKLLFEAALNPAVNNRAKLLARAVKINCDLLNLQG